MDPQNLHTPIPSGRSKSWYPVTPTSLSTSFDESTDISMLSVRSSPTIKDIVLDKKGYTCHDFEHRKSYLQIALEQLPSLIVYYFWDPLKFLSSPEKGPGHQHYNTVLIIDSCEAKFVSPKNWLIALGVFITTFSLWTTQLCWVYAFYMSIQWYHWLYLATGIMLEYKFYNNRFGFATSSKDMSLFHIPLVIGAIMIEIHLGILVLGMMIIIGFNGLAVPYLLVTPSRLSPTYTFKVSKIKLNLSSNYTFHDFSKYVKHKYKSIIEGIKRHQDRPQIFKKHNTTYNRGNKPAESIP